MSQNLSRRNFLKAAGAGLLLPAAGCVSTKGPTTELQETPNRVVYRTLGKTGLKVSGVGYGIGFVPVTEVVARALDMGINYYDTSRDYGDSEKIFSGVVKGRDRSKIIIATKSPSRRKADILNDLDTSLKALGTDYVDIWHLHARDTPASIPDEALEAMLECKKSGKARFVGFSCHDPNRMVDFVLETKTFDVIQTTYSHPIGGFYRDRAIKKLHDAGIGIIAMKVVVALTGLNLAKLDNPPAKTGEGPLAGIKWVLNNPAIGTTVPHMKTIPELEMNFRAMSEPYTPSDEKLLYVMNEQIRPSYCRMCYECSGKCPQGLPVTDMLRFLAYHDYCGNYHQARASFAGLPKEIRAVRCSDCSGCVIQCPNGVHVQDRLIRAQELLA
ncbi:MAG: aldo/keto reductase [Deltaproteobacteria bacterium]|nr:aldo/keto reductase [Deltaproteobacteria bacterium]